MSRFAKVNPMDLDDATRERAQGIDGRFAAHTPRRRS